MSTPIKVDLDLNLNKFVNGLNEAGRKVEQKKLSIDIDISKVKNRLTELQEKLKTATGTRKTAIELDIKKAELNLKKFEGDLKELNKPIHIPAPNTAGFESGLGKLKGLIGATIGFAVITKGFAEIVEAGSKFQSSMADFSALTGVSGKALDGFGESAKKLALQFGTGVVENIESFKGILSRLGPDIAKSPEALDKMAVAVNTLSQASGLTATDSMGALTTAMLQYSVDLTDPIAASKEMERMMNVMAAAAKEGEAEIPSIAQALEVSGAMAKTAGVSFEELNAGIKVLATRGKVGAEAGTALRNVMLKLSEGRFMPKDVLDGLKSAGVDIAALSDKTLPLKARLEALAPVMKDDALIGKLFGAENVVAGKALLENTVALGNFTTKLTGTNTAYEQAAVKGQTFEVAMNKLKAMLEVELIGVFNKLAPIISGFAKGLSDGFTFIKEHSDSLVPALVAVSAMILGSLVPSLTAAAVAAWAAIAPLAPFILATAAVGAAVFALSGGFNKSTESKIRDVEATQKLNDKEIENLKTKKDVLQSQIDLAEAYKELASKEKLSADEKKRLKEISDQLHKIYPTVTIDTNNYAGSIKGIEEAAGLSGVALDKLEGDMNKLSKRSRELMIDNLNLQRTLITEKFTDAFRPGLFASQSAMIKFATGMKKLEPLFKTLAYSTSI